MRITKSGPTRGRPKKDKEGDPRDLAVSLEQNLLFTWLEERVNVEDKKLGFTTRTPNRDLYADYLAWCEKQDAPEKRYKLTPIRWGLALKRIGYVSRRYNGEKVHWGMTLR